MNIRPMRAEDIDELRKIHEQFYHEEFDIAEFDKKFISLFSVVNDNGDLVTLGGIRQLAEAVIVTNKNLSSRERISGLNEMLSMLSIVARHSGHDAIHAFIQDQNWLEQLKTAGFMPTIGQSVIYKLMK